MNQLQPALRHPCFHAAAKGTYGRIHLPVAAGCNIACGFCHRRYDCVNESRPGVASRLLSPDAAVQALKAALERMPFLSVVGIAGPGDPLAAPEQTLRTLAMVRVAHPELLLCLATNGLALPTYADELIELGVGHVTVTVNAVHPAIGAAVVRHVSWQGRRFQGEAGASLLLERQLAGIAKLKAAGVMVKVNTVVVPGVNDHHVGEIAATLANLRVDRMNCMGILPVAGTPLGHVIPPTAARLEELRAIAAVHVPQMRHCTRCRADAMGLLSTTPPCATDRLG